MVGPEENSVWKVTQEVIRLKLQLKEGSALRGQVRLLGALSSLALKISKDEDCTSSMGDVFHYMNVPMVKKVLLIASLNLLRFKLYPLSLVLPPYTTMKSLVPSYW